MKFQLKGLSKHATFPFPAASTSNLKLEAKAMQGRIEWNEAFMLTLQSSAYVPKQRMDEASDSRIGQALPFAFFGILKSSLKPEDEALSHPIEWYDELSAKLDS